MAAAASALVATAAPGAAMTEIRTAFMRYVGQGHEIPVRIPARDLANDDIDGIGAAYEAAYTRFYDRPVPGSDVEVLSFSVIVSTEGGATKPAPPAADVPTKPPPIDASRAYTQRVRDGGTGAVADWAVFLRADLLAGQRVSGPAIVAEDETSTLISAGWSVIAGKTGYLMLDKDGP
ncbi:MAG: hypothetical protein ACREE3_15145 [Stellaceae bacterium]